MSSWLHGYVDPTGSFVVRPSLRMAQPFQDGIAGAAPFGEQRFGFLGTDGRWVVEPTLDFFGSRGEDTVTVNVGGQWGQNGVEGGAWGLVSREGMLIEPRLEGVGTFAAGRLPFRQGDLWGYVDRTGKVVIPPRFQWAGGFEDGVAIAVENGQDGFLKPDGTWLLEPAWASTMGFSAGRGRVQVEGAWFLVDRDGQILSEGFDEIWPFLGGMARVQRGGSYGFVGLDGALIGEAWFDESPLYDAGLAPVRRGEEWFFLDKAGTLHGPYERTFVPTEGRARFVRDGGVGFVALDGTELVPPDYETALGFTAGYAGVKRDGKWTFLDKSGGEIAPPTFDLVRSFSADGVAPVQVGQTFGILDTSGELVAEPTLDSLESFADGRARAQRVRFPATLHKAPAGWHAVPAECLAFRGFEGSGPEDDLRAIVCFSPGLDPDQLTRASHLFGCWLDLYRRQVEPNEPMVGETWLVDYGLSVRVRGLQDPVKALDTLVHELAKLDLPIREVVFGRFRENPEHPPAWNLMYYVMPAVPHPDDPQGPWWFADWDSYWEQVWDLDDVPPAAESLQNLRAGRWNPRTESLVFDERIFSLYVPGVRIAYGVFQGGFTEEEDDARAAEVTEAVNGAFQRRFDPARIWVFPGNTEWQPPYPMRRDWEYGVEPIDCEGRRGYYFAVDCAPLLHDVGPDAFRYREPELMEALAEVIAELGLAPVILWQRFGDPLPGPSMAGAAHPMNPTFYLLELWEA